MERLTTGQYHAVQFYGSDDRLYSTVSAFLAEDAQALLSMMDRTLWFTRFAAELPQEALAGDLQAFFARADLSGGLAPSAVYDLDSLEVSPVEGPPAWGPCYAGTSATSWSRRTSSAGSPSVWEARPSRRGRKVKS
jgi:hypothetical protein